MKMMESSQDRDKTLREKEKLLVRSNFSFFHSVFKRLVPQTCKNQSLFGKRLRVKSYLHFCYILIVNPLPANKSLALSKLKVYADYNCNVAQKVQIFL